MPVLWYSVSNLLYRRDADMLRYTMTVIRCLYIRWDKNSALNSKLTNKTLLTTFFHSGRLATLLCDLDLGSGHTAYRRVSLIDLCWQRKFCWNLKKNFWGHMAGFVRSTQSSRPKNTPTLTNSSVCAVSVYYLILHINCQTDLQIIRSRHVIKEKHTATWPTTILADQPINNTQHSRDFIPDFNKVTLLPSFIQFYP